MAMVKMKTVITKVTAVATKEKYRRPIVPKSYSYRYEVGSDAGPADDPLIEAGAGIIESRYRGRTSQWRVSRSPVATETYIVTGSYVHPLPDNLMAYPSKGVNPTTHAAVRSRMMPNAPRVIHQHKIADTLAKPASPPPTRRESARPTPANEPAYRRNR